MNKKSRTSLWIYFALIVFGTIAIIFIIITAILVLLYHFDLISPNTHDKNFPIIILSITSILIGVAISLFVGKLIIKPIENLGKAFEKLSKGDFEVRLPEINKIHEIREMSIGFNKMVRGLSNIETLRSDFVVNVSHEFKTPLSTIEGYATLLQDDTLTTIKRDLYITKILDNSRQLSNLSGNILSLSKLENQEDIIHKTAYRIDEQIRKAVLQLENKWSEKNLDLDIELPYQYFTGNELLLYRVWFNIIENAIKYSYEGGYIKILLESKPENIIVSISDKGCGMSDEIKKHIFEKFYQGDSARNKEGNGLGLALIKRIIDLCEGSVTVFSEVNKGSIFTVILPKIGTGSKGLQKKLSPN